MMKNPDQSIVGADPSRFSEFVDANGLVCFQIQTTFSFREVPRTPIIRVSREVWLGIHDVAAPKTDQALTPDELLVESVISQVDQRIHRGKTRVPGIKQISDHEFQRLMNNLLEHQIWDEELEVAVLGDAAERRDRQVKTGSLYLKRATEWHQISRRPKGRWNGRFFVPFDGF
jgi:hypothetical protein